MSDILLSVFLLVIFGWQYKKSKYTKNNIQVLAVILTIYTIGKIAFFSFVNWTLFVTFGEREVSSQFVDIKSVLTFLDKEQLFGGIEIIILALALFFAFKVLREQKYSITSA